MLKHYKQEHLSSSHITSTTFNSVQNMIECNSTLSTKSKSKSDDSTTIISTSTDVDLYTDTYQYHQFDHFNHLPNQMYFFLNMFHPFLGGMCGIVWCTIT